LFIYFSNYASNIGVAERVKVRIAGRSIEMKTAREEVVETLTGSDIMWLYPRVCQGDLWWRVMCYLQHKTSPGPTSRLGDISSDTGVRETIIPILFRLVKEQNIDIVMTITVSSRALYRSACHDEPLFAEVQFRRRPHQPHVDGFNSSDIQFDCSIVLRTPPASPPTGADECNSLCYTPPLTLAICVVWEFP